MGIEKSSVPFFVEENFKPTTHFIDSNFSCYEPNYYIVGDLSLTFDSSDANNRIRIKLNCVRCDGTSYNTVNKSYVNYDSNGKLHVHNSTCYQCPFQASCINGIKSRGNYWGYSNSSGYVTFKICPPFYCCDRLKRCHSYNTCANRRQGRLCGGCRPGDFISIFSHNKCVDSSKCLASWFWIVFAIVIVLSFGLLLYHKDVLLTIKNKLHKLYARLTRIDRGESVRNRFPDTPYNLISDNEENETNSHNELNFDQQSYISGLIKITFFFYQTASIIRITSSAKMEYHLPYLIETLSSFFDIKIAIKSSNLIDLCPIQTQSIAAIELFRLSIVLSCIILIPVSLVAVSLVRYHQENQYKTSPFVNRLKVSYVQILILGYASIATFCLQSVDCIEIDGGLWIFNQAEVACYQQWQIMVFVVICLWIVPFPFVLYFGCCWLRSKAITPNEMLVTLTFPPVVLLYKTRNWYLGQSQNVWPEQMTIEQSDISNFMNQPFRLNINEVETSEQIICKSVKIVWEPVFVARRLILIISTTFIRSPIMKLYPTGFLLIMFSIHDYTVKPFVEKSLNFIQLMSMLLLITLAFDIIDNSEYYLTGKILLFIELIILLSPIILVIVALFYRLFNYIYKLFLRKLD
ncbi:uncharacterized protein [Clytia hemisphaerica]|uniref:uncharacterized protein n=1 Tax=Clytia hemisphaerica TaxID=252671 RepID=UPI0034D56D9C